MRWPNESAITRRDDHLVRTRRLSLWIAGGATAASLGLATAFGYALPGHAVAATGKSPAGQGSGQGHQGSGGSHQHGTGGLTAPQQPPAQPAAPPVVSSGGS